MKQALALMAAPFMGLGYVLVLPFLALAMVAALAGAKVLSVLLWIGGLSTSFGWRPVEACLAGRKKNRKKDKGR